MEGSEAKRWGLRLAAIALTVAFGLAMAPAYPAKGVSIWPPVNWTFTADGGFRPKALPRKGPAPISFFFSGRIESLSGAVPPALRTMELEGDKHIAFDVEGVPACGRADLRPTSTAQVRRVCGGALLGSGKARLLLAYPEVAPNSVRSELLIVNGGFRAGVTTLFLRAHVSNPTPMSIVAPIKIKKIDNGRYGLRATASIPKFADGFGSVESFSLKIEKGVLTGTCFDGHLQVAFAPTFADGTALSGVLVQPCAPKG